MNSIRAACFKIRILTKFSTITFQKHKDSQLAGTLTAKIHVNNIAGVNTGAVTHKVNVHNYSKDYCRGQKKNMR